MALRAHLAFKYRVPEDQAADFLQGFVVERILKKGLLALADPARGKFHRFLYEDTRALMLFKGKIQSNYEARLDQDSGLV